MAGILAEIIQAAWLTKNADRNVRTAPTQSLTSWHDKLMPMPGSRAAVRKDGAASTWETSARTIIPAWARQQHSDSKLREELASSVADQPHVSSAPFVPLMTIGETAAILHLAPRTIHRMIERGDLHAVRIGRSIRIRREDIRQVIYGTSTD